MRVEENASWDLEATAHGRLGEGVGTVLLPPAQYLVHKSLAASCRHVAASYWTVASDVAPTSAPVNAAGQRWSTPPVNNGLRRRPPVNGGGSRWQSSLGHGPVWIGSGLGLDQVWVGSGLGPPRGMPRVSHVCPRGVHVDADVDIKQQVGFDLAHISDPRVPLILGIPFLRTARALIDVHGEEMILQSTNMINIYDDSSEDFLEDLFATNHQSGNPTFSSHPELTSPEVKDNVFDPEGGNVLIEILLDLDSTKYLYPPHNVNPLSGNTTSSSSPNHLLEEFADELALITSPPGNDDLPFDIESDLKEIEYLLHHDPIKEMDSILKDSIDQIESDTEYVFDDPFDSKGEKIKESKLLIDELDIPRSSDFLPSSEYDSFLFEDFSEVDALPSTNN
nr:hypothetical protein [Tanacetum cinerariifolium]